MKDIYLHDTTHGSNTKQGNADLLGLLSVIALIILSLAIINYINLTAAQQNKRNKETGIKKTIGADRNNILFHYMVESLLITILAFITGLLMLWILLPFYETVFNTTLNIKLFFTFSLYSFIVNLSFPCRNDKRQRASISLVWCKSGKNLKWHYANIR